MIALNACSAVPITPPYTGGDHTTAGKPSHLPSAKWRPTAARPAPTGTMKFFFSCSSLDFFQPKSVPTPIRKNTPRPSGCRNAL